MKRGSENGLAEQKWETEKKCGKNRAGEGRGTILKMVVKGSELASEEMETDRAPSWEYRSSRRQSIKKKKGIFYIYFSC